MVEIPFPSLVKSYQPETISMNNNYVVRVVGIIIIIIFYSSMEESENDERKGGIEMEKPKINYMIDTSQSSLDALHKHSETQLFDDASPEFRSTLEYA